MQNIPNRAATKDLSVNFLPHKLRPFNFLTKMDGRNPSEIDFKVRLPAPTISLLIQNSRKLKKSSKFEKCQNNLQKKYSSK